MTQLELAEKSGVSRTTLSKLENNKNPEVMAGTLKAIAQALGVKVSALL
nr:MAG TPA: helix-turn-helix domain protein [Caudoviricetes sp.]